MQKESTARILGLSSITVFLSVTGALFLMGCPAKNPPQTVAQLDIAQYMGLWYEIARFPVFFERNLVGVTAEYTLEEDGRIRLINRGYKETLDGKVSRIQGYASLPDENEPAKLRIRFDPFPVCLFPADYWIIQLDEAYRYAVVSNPTRSVLWILSRTPNMEEELYNAIVEELTQQGFDVEKLEKTLQDVTGTAE